MAVGMSHSISCEDRPPEASRPADGEAANAMTWSVCSSITKDACKASAWLKQVWKLQTDAMQYAQSARTTSVLCCGAPRRASLPSTSARRGPLTLTPVHRCLSTLHR